MFTVRPEVYIRKVHVDIKSTELWMKQLNDKMSSGVRETVREGGRREGLWFSQRERHTQAFLYSFLIRWIRYVFQRITHLCTHTRKVSRGRITSQQKSLLCLRFQSGEIVSKISHPITSVTVLLERESRRVFVCGGVLHMQWQKEKWRVSMRETWRARERSALNHCVLWIHCGYFSSCHSCVALLSTRHF